MQRRIFYPPRALQFHICDDLFQKLVNAAQRRGEATRVYDRLLSGREAFNLLASARAIPRLPSLSAPIDRQDHLLQLEPRWP